MNSRGANQRLLSATHIAKSFGFVFSFFCQSEIPKISRHYKYTQTLRLSPKPVLFIGCVAISFLYFVIISIFPRFSSKKISAKTITFYWFNFLYIFSVTKYPNFLSDNFYSIEFSVITCVH